MKNKFQADKGYYAELEGNFLKHLGYEYSEYLCEELDCQRADVENIPVPEELQQWFYTFHKQEKRRNRRNKFILGIRNNATKAAIIGLGFIGLNKVLTDNVDAYRVTVQNAVLHMQEKFTQIDIFDKGYNDLGLPPNWVGYYYPSYVPDGYSIVSTSILNRTATIEYVDADGNRLSIHQVKQSFAHRTDAEHGNVKEYILDHGEKGYFFVQDNINCFTFALEEYRITLYGTTLGYKELIKISNSMEMFRD